MKLSYQQQLSFDTIMHYFLNNHDERIFVFSGTAGCVDSETEFLTPIGWKKISEWNGEQVMQYNLDGTSEFVKPLDYIKLPCEKFYHLKTKYGIDQMLSPEHRILYRSRKTKKYNVISMEEMYQRNLSAKNNWTGQIPTTFSPRISGRLNISDEELRVQIAVIADGTFPSHLKNNRCYINIKKQRKVKRLEMLLTNAKIEYNKTIKQNGYSLFSFISPIKTKQFDEHFYDCSLDQLKVIVGEIFYWDGSIENKQFFSTEKKSADFIQYAISSTGCRSVIYKDVRKGRNTCYTVSLTDKKFVSLWNRTEKNIKIKHIAGEYKYCFSVPSTFLVLRRNDKIFITGNSGKTTIINELNSLLKNVFYKNVSNITLTGKASQVMAHKGISNATTIHRYMYIPIVDSFGNLIRFDKKSIDDFSDDFVIIDEASMVTEDIFIDLWNLGKRMLFVGDINQLPPISKNGFNVMDMAHIRLDEIHRLAADNPIIKLAHHVLDTGKLSKKFTGNKISFYNQNNLQTHLDKYGKTYDTILCGTNRKRISINKKMRKIYGRKSEFHPDLPVTGDQVMCLRNNYQVYPEIYNGDTFRVVNSSEPYDISEYDYNKKKMIDREIIDMDVINDFSKISTTLQVDANAWNGGGYKYNKEINHFDFSSAITVHKSQGSEYDNVCFIDEDVSYFLEQEKFRYTAITRSKDKLGILV